MLSEKEQRQAVITEAMTWLRTPHHNGARLKGVGVDCGQFPISVYSSCGLIPEITPERYSPQFALNQGEEWYLKIVEQFGRELPKGELPKAGDFMIIKLGRVYSHGAIIIDWPRIIHSAWNIGVVLDVGDQGWIATQKSGKPRETKFFTLW